jgi:two-component system CheB/CheR fusion protein
MASKQADQNSAGFSELLEFLKESRGFDFTGYKRTTLQRRIEKRMEAVAAGSFAAYQDHLQASPREFTDLFNTILINVTSFFRDGEAWDYIRSDVVPSLLEDMSPGEVIRVWSAGCSSGEEAYTLAMVLAEVIGLEAFRDRVKIYATDVDEDALSSGRQAVYPNDALKDVPEELVERYFEPTPSGMMFRPDLRRSIIFGRNDLVSDAPISRIDLLLCRNTLMYFTPETQAGILRHFNFSVTPRGFLFLGKSEMLVTHSDLFSPTELKWRVFRKVLRDNVRERLGFLPPANGGEVAADPQSEMRTGAAALAPVAQILVDRRGSLAEANSRARELFALGTPDIGQPFQDLSLSYRPADLRSAIEQAYEKRIPVRVGRFDWPGRDGAAESILEIDVTPVPGPTGAPLGAMISFTDVTVLVRLSLDYERSKRELDAAYEELQSTVEELETTNEELQSTNEELETTNEELQSTNEELETMNEELQSTNDELETMNTEVNTRATELDRVNLFLEGILGSLGVGVAVIDRDRNVQVWNDMSNELWGLRSDEAEGKDLLTLDIGLPVAQLTDSVATVLSGGTESADQTLSALDRRGRKFECEVQVMALATGAGDTYGAIVLMSPSAAAPEAAAPAAAS